MPTGSTAWTIAAAGGSATPASAMPAARPAPTPTSTREVDDITRCRRDSTRERLVEADCARRMSPQSDRRRDLTPSSSF